MKGSAAVSRVKVSAYGHGVGSHGGVGMLQRGGGADRAVSTGQPCWRIPTGASPASGTAGAVIGNVSSAPPPRLPRFGGWSMRPSARYPGCPRARSGPRVGRGCGPRCRSVAADGCRCHHHYRPSDNKRDAREILNTTDGWSPAIESCGVIRDGAWSPRPPGCVTCHRFDANAAWLEIILAATDLVAWTKLIGTATVLVHPFRCLLLSSSVTAHDTQQQDFDSVLVGPPPSSGKLGAQTFQPRRAPLRGRVAWPRWRCGAQQCRAPAVHFVRGSECESAGVPTAVPARYRGRPGR